MGVAFKISGDWAERAPRYSLRPGDDQQMRFCRLGDSKKVAKTRMLNISMTGLAFAVDGRAIPHIGEIIKIEMKMPGETETIIRLGRVVRLEPDSATAASTDIMVGVEYVVEDEVAPKNIFDLKSKLVLKDTKLRDLWNSDTPGILLLIIAIAAVCFQTFS